MPRITATIVAFSINYACYFSEIYRGGIEGVPQGQREAGEVLGMTKPQIFFKITLPYMLHVTGPHLITQFVGNINNFNIIWLLTGGGPIDINNYTDQAQSTDLLVTWLYRLTTDQNPKYNVASVIGIVIFVISAVLSLITYNMTSSAKREDIFQ